MTKFSFANKSNRDAYAKIKKNQGFQVKKSVIKNQLCDPRYMADYDARMGNDYQTFFPSIYVLDVY